MKPLPKLSFPSFLWTRHAYYNQFVSVVIEAVNLFNTEFNQKSPEKLSP